MKSNKKTKRSSRYRKASKAAALKGRMDTGMNIPNKLTLLRIILIPFFIYFMLAGMKYVTLIIFCAASFTDWLDGYIARKYNLVSDFGKFADPLADKLLIISALVCFVEMGRLPAWLVIVVVSREFIVTGLRLAARESSGKVISAGIGGKVKTVWQIVAVIVMILDFPVLSIGVSVGQLCMYVALIITVWSGIQYLYQNRDLIDYKK